MPYFRSMDILADSEPEDWDHMMIRINYLKDGGTVSVRISIKTALPWEYEYVTKAPPPFASDSTKPGSFPHVLPLGNPPSLHRDIHGFEVEMHNPSPGNQGYSVSFEWIQEDPASPGSEKRLHEEKEDGMAKPGETLTFGGSTKFFETP